MGAHQEVGVTGVFGARRQREVDDAAGGERHAGRTRDEESGGLREAPALDPVHLRDAARGSGEPDPRGPGIQRQLLRDRPELIDNAVEELIRYDTTAQFTGRNTTGPIEVGDVTIPAGANVALMIGAANRDRRRWPDADVLRLDRPDPRPISFGHAVAQRVGEGKREERPAGFRFGGFEQFER